MDWFLYDNGLRHERVKKNKSCHVQNDIMIIQNNKVLIEEKDLTATNH